jgi:perosamine synthetase|tara:strand:- start:5798 stop:6907 length:1110 start_codon:yes stop_codon:yes gene_type:complete
MIPVFKPCYGKKELEALCEPFRTGWIGSGPKTKEFEEKFAKYIGVKYAVATNSCTASLHLAMKVMNIEDCEVITTPMTFVATNHAILYNNGIPVFSDIYADTLNINPEKVKDLITNKTRAIVVVHYGGHSCDMDVINEIANRYKLVVIEDVAHGCGGEYKGKRLGSLGDIACFSFNAVKNLATGDGGMITTNNFEVYKRLLKLSWMGISKNTWARQDDEKYSWHYNVDEVGYKYQMNDIVASIGLVQLAKLDKMNEKRREIIKKYNNGFTDLDWIVTPTQRSYTKRACHNYVIKLDERDKLNIYLKENRISTGIHYIPNNHYEMYKDCQGKTPVCEKVWLKLLTLPLFPDLTDSEISMIVEKVRLFKEK